jgi:hypothetical protein
MIDGLTAPRVALLAFLAVFAMFILILHAECPLQAALQRVVVLQQARQDAKLSPVCQGVDFRGYSLDRPMNSFDGRPDGYDRDEAGRILCAMHADSRAAGDIYLWRHFPLDMIYAGFFGLTFAALWLFLVGAFGWQRSGLQYLALLPILGGLLDWTENLSVLFLVWHGPPGNETIISFASIITQAKWWVDRVSAIAVLGLLAAYLVRHSLRGRSQRG